MNDKIESDVETGEEVHQEQTLLSHLIELRERLLKMVLAVALVLIGLVPFANKLYALLAQPLTSQLPQGASMIAIDVAAPILIPFKLAFFVAIFVTVPYLLYHVWAFIAPGLYKHEKRLVTPLVISSTVLFYLGVAFAYFIVFPVMFAFIINIAPETVAVQTDIGRYLDFVITLFLAFGAAFEIPVATVLLVAIGVTTPEALAAKRPFVIVGAFIIGMLLTPPDVISQLLLAIPMWILFEAGIIVARMVRKQDEPQATDEESNLSP